jgi:ferredoxin--NADP+ reductase
MEHDPTNASLIERVDLTDVLSVVKIRPDSGTIPPFVPGQFFRLGLPRVDEMGGVAVRKSGRVRYTKRAYSIASSANITDHVEFFVVRVEEGALTPRLWDLDVGDRIWLDSAAKGEFTLDLAPAGKDLVMVSTGTGIAPFVSMLRTYRGQDRWRRFVLVNGSRFAADLAYRDEVHALVRTDPTVYYIPLVTREPAGGAWAGLRGRVQVALEPATYAKLVGAPLDPATCHVFLCGNPAMIDEVQAILEARGFQADTRDAPGNIHFERYW